MRPKTSYLDAHFGTLSQGLDHRIASVLLTKKDSRNEIIYDFQSPFCLHILNLRTKLAGLDFCSTYPSSIYSWFLKPLSVLHSQLPTKNIFFDPQNMKKPPQKVAYLSRNSIVSEIFLFQPNSPNGRFHVPKCGL